MRLCHKCKRVIIGESYDRTIFIPPAIVTPQRFCKDCFDETREREAIILPVVILFLFFFILVIILFFVFEGM